MPSWVCAPAAFSPSKRSLVGLPRQNRSGSSLLASRFNWPRACSFSLSVIFITARELMQSDARHCRRAQASHVEADTRREALVGIGANLPSVRRRDPRDIIIRKTDLRPAVSVGLILWSGCVATLPIDPTTQVDGFPVREGRKHVPASFGPISCRSPCVPHACRA